jgi:glycosyltransferase involved in cell wall biosynthesis
MSTADLTVMPLVATMIGTTLIVFGFRRIVFVSAALLSPRSLAPAKTPGSMLVLMAARNEAAVVESALRSFDRLAHRDSIEVTLIDDGSTDGTNAILARWAESRLQSRVVTISRLADSTGGKSAALAAGLAASPRTDLVAVVDADFEVIPDGLERLAAGFSDTTVGAVSGYLRPRNAELGIVARYAALESWLHQLVTSAAKDRLDLDPPTIGVWMVRRDILDSIGGFPSCVTGEDVRVAAAITRRGFRTRFISTAVGSNQVAATLAEYWWQHLRWARDVYATGRRPRSPSETIRAQEARETRRALLPRIERILSASGYADRLALVTGAALTACGSLSAAILLFYVTTIVIEIAVATRRGASGRHGETLRVLAAAATVLAVDVIATAVATIGAAIGAHPSWRRSERRPEPIIITRRGKPVG